MEVYRRAELAEVGSYQSNGKDFVIYIVSRDTIKNPHIHIGDAETYPYCNKFNCCLDLIRPEYVLHHKKLQSRFDDSELNGLIEFIHNIDEDGDRVWQYIVKTWNKNNSNNRLSLDTPIPDYRVLI